MIVSYLSSYWGIKKMNDELFDKFFALYLKATENDDDRVYLENQFNNLIVHTKNTDVHSFEFIDLVDKILKPTEIQKKKNAEITTPFNLAREMIDKIDEEFWKSPKKVFEPCCGKGIFCLLIYNKFWTGLKDLYPDEHERRKVILNECIYFADIDALNIFIVEGILSNKGEFKINYHHGNTLELDIKATWGIDGFDLYVCNPPYEDNSAEKRKALNHNLWSEFLNWSYDRLNDNGKLLYITPTSWMSPTSKNKDIFYKNHIIYLNVNECKKHFNVGSTFSYYIIKKTKVIGDTEVVCEYNKKIYKSVCNLKGMEYLPNFTTNKTISIIKKIHKQ